MDEANRPGRRQWGVIALVLCDAFLLTGAFVWFWNDEPTNEGVHGTVVVQRCLATTGKQAYCYGPFTADDGSLSIPEVEVVTEPNREVAEGWVDSPDDTVASPTVQAKPPPTRKRVELVAYYVLAMAVHAFLLVRLLRERPPSTRRRTAWLHTE